MLRFSCCRPIWRSLSGAAQSAAAPSSPQHDSPARSSGAPADGAAGGRTHAGATDAAGAAAGGCARNSRFTCPCRHSRNPFAAYRPSTAPELDLTNSPRLENLIRDGKLYISLKDAIALAIENNLDLAYFRYNFPIAQTDILRTKSGAPPTVSTPASPSPPKAASAPPAAGAAAARSRILSRRGRYRARRRSAQGTTVPSFDPFLTFKGYVDHTTIQEANQFQVGTPTLKTNTIEGTGQLQPVFSVRHQHFAQYLGSGKPTTSPYNTINPTLYSSFAVEITQPFLAGFGLATNERYIRIAKRNAQITDLAFKAQVIATVTQVENIYWDLVNAYQDEQIKARSLGFAQQTLD